jgi:hypothetical protein
MTSLGDDPFLAPKLAMCKNRRCMAAASTPPRPRPSLRVGVTGHRLHRLLEADVDVGAVRSRVRAALAEIKRAASDVAAEYAAVYDGEPVLRVISPLAEGADQITADEAVGLGYDLHVPLPCAAGPYAAGFQVPPDTAAELNPCIKFEQLLGRAQVVQILDDSPDAVLDGAAYATVGRTVLRHSDILIAIWDGSAAAGSGGTAAVVEQARSWQVPTVIIDPRHPDRWTIDARLDGWTAPDLAAIVRDVLAPPPDADGSPIASALQEYLRTKAVIGVGGLFATLVRVVSLDSPLRSPVVRLGGASLRRARAEWDALWHAPPRLDPAIVHPITEELTSYYVWADGLADRYGTLHRDASVVPFVFGLLATAIGVLAHLSDLGPWLELLTLCVALMLYGFVTHGRYHNRWIDYRSLAEQIRQLAFLWPVGRPLHALRFGGESESEAPRFAWVGWYARAVARQLGLYPAVFTPERLATCRRIVVERFVEPQQRYHARTERRFQTVDERLHTVTTAVFFGALVVVAVDAAQHPFFGHQPLVGSGHATISIADQAIVFLAAFLPALAASTHGFHSQGDFWNLSRRSARMSEQLRPLATDRATVQATPTLESLGELAVAAADTMGDEMMNWRVFVRLKAPSLV